MSKPSFILTSSGRPCCSFYFDTSIISARKVVLKWSIPEKLNGYNPIFYINVNAVNSKNENISLEVAYKSLVNDAALQNNEILYTINNLKPYSQYIVLIKVCNQVPTETNCLVGSSGNNPTNNIIFYTQQDVPEMQPPPIIIDVNSTSAVLSISKPLITIGVLLLYEVWLKNLNKIPTSIK